MGAHRRRRTGAVLVATVAAAVGLTTALVANGPAGAAPRPAPAAAAPLVTFKALFLLYPHVRIPGQPARDFRPGELETVKNAISVTWPQEISTYTNGQVRVIPTIVVPPHDLTSNGPYREGTDPNSYPGVWPEDIPNDVRDYVGPAGRYDSVFVFDANPVFHPVTSGAGANTTSAHVTWHTQGVPPDPKAYGFESDTLAGFKHEWLHGLSSYYYRDKGLNARSPECGENPDGRDGVHCAEEYGYPRAQNGYQNFNGWYRDYLNGTIAGGSKGLGPIAWAKGVPRARYGGPLDGSDGTTPPPPTPTGKTVVGTGSNRCLDVDHSLTADGTAILIYDCHGDPNQRWSTDGGRLVNAATAKCLTPKGKGTTDGTQVWQETCRTGDTSQQWTVRADGTLRNTASGKCLDVAKKATANGALVQLWGCNPSATTGANQRWTLKS